MNKIKIIFFTILLTLSQLIIAQNNTNFDFTQRSEAYFTIQIDSQKELSILTNVISIDKVDGNTVYAYANQKEYNHLLSLGYETFIQTPPSMLEKAVMKNFDEINNQKNDWNYYPTYEAYVEMMNQFAIDYPSICQTINIGTTVQNRELLVCKISTNVTIEEVEPQVFYSSTMHGDEVTGYVLMLRFIDYLLSNYGTNSEITNLLDNMEIWICPLANPDGTYHNGNNSVNGAIRYNANNVDLNRNYKDFIYGDHPDDEDWQVETIAFMNFQEQHNFVLGINIHGGAEVVNYPWDNHSSLHADDTWWQFICREYVDTVHQYASNNYMTDLNNGITNGYAWYQITGSRQDYTNYYDNNRELTLEISSSKTPNANNLPNFWNYNYRSFLNLLKQANYGIQGVITDAETGLPLEAKVFVEEHDINTENSFVYSNESNGSYFRPIKAGTYNVTYSAYGYHSQTHSISVSDYQTEIKNVALTQGTLIADFSANQTTISVGETVQFTDLTFGDPTSWEWICYGGTPAISNLQNPIIAYDIEGTYDVMLIVTKEIAKTVYIDTILKTNYITVSDQFLMQNGTATTCSGLFLDDGGLDNNYSNRKNDQYTIFPADSTAKISVNFTTFALESDYDFLKIYDASTNSSSSLIGLYSGSNSPGTITATNSEGALTFVFTSDHSVNDIGWVANISCQGGSGSAPNADFTSNVTEIKVGETVQFTDLSTNNPTNWLWFFEGGTPETSTEQNPLVEYNSLGVFDVSLTVSNEFGNEIKIVSEYITVNNVSNNEYIDDNQVNIFPNPAQTSTIIQSDKLIQKVEIYSIIGQLLQEVEPNNSIFELSTNTFDNGIYLIQIYSNNQLFTKRLVVSK